MSEDFNVVEAFNGKALGDRFAIYVPNRDRDGLIIDQNIWVNKAMKVLADIAGGATAMPPVKGAWLNPISKELIIEEPVVVYAFIDPDTFEECFDTLHDLVREIGRQTNQGSMAVEYGDTFIYVDDFGG